MIQLITDLLSPELMQNMFGFLIAMLVLITIIMTGSRRLKTMVRLFTLQSFCLVLIVLISGISSHKTDIFFIAGITFLGKCILIPWILVLVLSKVQIRKEVETYVSLPVSMLLVCGLTALIFYLATNIGIEKEILSLEILTASIALILIGLFIMMTRKKAIAQILGLYVMENGIFALAIGTIFEMPMVVEMGIFLDLLIGAMVMGIWVYRIKQSFDTINVEELQKLRG